MKLKKIKVVNCLIFKIKKKNFYKKLIKEFILIYNYLKSVKSSKHHFTLLLGSVFINVYVLLCD